MPIEDFESRGPRYDFTIFPSGRNYTIREIRSRDRSAARSSSTASEKFLASSGQRDHPSTILGGTGFPRPGCSCTELVSFGERTVVASTINQPPLCSKSDETLFLGGSRPRSRPPTRSKTRRRASRFKGELNIHVFRDARSHCAPPPTSTDLTVDAIGSLISRIRCLGRVSYFSIRGKTEFD